MSTSTDKATKYLFKIIGILFSLVIAWAIQWFIVGHWGWQGYGKFSFYLYVWLNILTAVLYVFAFLGTIA